MDANPNTPNGHLEPRWPASIAIASALALYVILPQSLIVGPRWLIPVLEAALLIPLTITNPYRQHHETRELRFLAIGLIALVNLANIASVVLLVHHLLAGGKNTSGKALVYAALAVWLTNVIVFGLWFWEIDKGGPAARSGHRELIPDFLFPQMTEPRITTAQWHPGFVDYLYVAFTNATAFSPTDTMPLTQKAKTLMAAESLVSMITVVVVAARAVNILP